MFLLPHRPLVRRLGLLPLSPQAHPLPLRLLGLPARSVHPCRARVSPCVRRHPALRARLVRPRLRKGTRPRRRALLAPVSALARRKACVLRVPRNPIVRPERRKVAPVEPLAKAVGLAVLRRAFRSGLALAAPVAATTKLP